MIIAIVLSAFLLLVAAVLRAALASLIRTPRADALHDAHEYRGADVAARLLDNRAGLQPSIGTVHSALLIAATLPAAWAFTVADIHGLVLVAALVVLGIVVVLFGDAVPRSIGRRSPAAWPIGSPDCCALLSSIGEVAIDLIADDELEDLDDDHDEDDHQEIEMISSVP